MVVQWIIAQPSILVAIECNEEESCPDDGCDLAHHEYESNELAKVSQLYQIVAVISLHARFKSKGKTTMLIFVDYILVSIFCKPGHHEGREAPVPEHHLEHIVNVKHNEDGNAHV